MFKNQFSKLKNLSLGILICLSANITFGQTGLNDGIKELERGRDATAKDIFINLVKKNSKDAMAYYQLGIAYLQSEQTDSANYFFNEGIKNVSGDPFCYIGLARVQFEKKNLSDAKANLDKAVTLSQGKNAKVFAEAAKAAVRQTNKNADWAIEYINKAKQIDSKNPEFYLVNGQALLEKGDGGAAASMYDKAMELDPKSAYFNYITGRLYMRARSFDVAKTNFEKSILLDPMFAASYSELGDIAYKQNNYDEASAKYKKYIDLVGNDVTARIRYASFLFLKKDFSGVAAEIETIRKIDKTNPGLLRLLGYSQFEQGKYTESKASLEEFFNTSKDGKFINTDYEYLAKSYDKTGNDSLALINYKKALELDTTRNDYYGPLAEKSTKLKRYDDAVNYYKAKIRNTKTKIGDTYLLGKAQYNAKQYDDADISFKFVIDNSPTTITAIIWRGRTASSKDLDSKKGISKPYYEEFLTKSNNDLTKYKSEIMECYEYLAFYYYQEKDQAKCEDNAKKLLEIDPSNAKAKQFLNYYKAKANQAAQQKAGAKKPGKK